MAATTAAVIGAGAAVKGTVDARKAAKDAAKSQERQNASNREFIEKQIGIAREDALSLLPAASQNVLAGAQGALDIFGQTVPQQIQALQAGSQAAREAILGTGTGEVAFTPDMSFAQQILPTLRPTENRFGTAENIFQAVDVADEETYVPEYLKGVDTNKQLWIAAATGQIPGLSASDQGFWRDHLQNATQQEFWRNIFQKNQNSSSNPSNLLSTSWVSHPQNVLENIVGNPSGFNSQNELRAARLLDAVINPRSDKESALRGFLGGV